jgi:hypothetical protein
MNQTEKDNLILQAAKKLGAPPDKLKEVLSHGKPEELLALLKPEQKEQLRGMMKDPKIIEKLKKMNK